MKAEIYLGLDKTTQVAYSTQLKVKGITFKSIYDRVCEHFEVTNLEEGYKKKAKAPMREIFLMLVFENFEMPEKGSSRFLTILGDMLGRDRTTILYYYRNLFQSGTYMTNVNYFYRGDYYINHFYSIKHKVMGTEVVDKKVYRVMPRKNAPTKLGMSLAKDRKEILNCIRRGEDLEYLNKKYFNYSTLRWLRERIRIEVPGLLRLMRYHDRKIEEMLG